MIDEVPIENVETTPEEPPQQEAPVVEAQEEPPKKTRGRPKGSCKPKKEEVKPKAKPKVQEECEEPKPPKKSKPKVQREEDRSSNEEIYRDIDTRAIAAEVISMLSNRHMDRSQQKREKYRSWFQNPQY